jgi:hypothetical protein
VLFVTNNLVTIGFVSTLSRSHLLHVRRVLFGNTCALLAAFAVLVSKTVFSPGPQYQLIRRAGELQVGVAN